MGIQVYNTFSQRKEPFITIEPGRVRMYVCGITPYDRVHLGHARCYVVFDVIHRFLSAEGFRVNYIQNFTDIDDKIIMRAREQNITTRALADANIADYHENMRRLNVLPANGYPLVTDHIDDIIGFVKDLVARKAAYAVGGNVYFSVRSFPSYGALSKRAVDDLQAGARVEVDPEKKDPLDFALWKKSLPGESWWDSPWGNGRPGWHIECSALSRALLGEEIDIHGGGQDLIFPHHENERAQSEACSGRQFVRYWVHNGFITMRQEKMSKSLGNIFSLDDLFERHDPMVVRLFLLGQHYRTPIDYTPEQLDQARRSYQRMADGVRLVCAAGQSGGAAVGAGDAAGRFARERELFTEVLRDDFNTARALGHFNTALSVLQAYRQQHPGGVPGALCAELRAMADILGIRFDEQEETLSHDVQSLIDRRQEARAAKQWAEADRLRGLLEAQGIAIEDTPQGVRWKRRQT